MKNLFTVLAAAAFLSLVATARADQTADQAELIRAEKNCTAALVASDLKVLGEFFAPDWKLVASDAAMMTREQLFKMLGSGALKFASCEQSDLEIRIYGDAAVVIGQATSKGEWKGEAFGSKERFTDVFIRLEGKWRCVSTHASDLPDDGK